MRVLICGDRDYQDENIIHDLLTGMYDHWSCGWLTVDLSAFVVIEGGCPTGADLFARNWVFGSPFHWAPVYSNDTSRADTTPMKILPLIDWYALDKVNDPVPDHTPVVHHRFDADWNRYGKGAGPIRNRYMAAAGKPDLVIGFHDNIAVSRGTKDMLNVAKGLDIKNKLVSAW